MPMKPPIRMSRSNLIDIPSAEYQDTMNIRLSGGDDTDIITVKDIPGYSAMLTRGQIIPLNDYIEAERSRPECLQRCR